MSLASRTLAEVGNADFDFIYRTDMISPEYSKSLRTAIMAQHEPQKWFKYVVGTKESGSQAFKEGRFKGARGNFVMTTDRYVAPKGFSQLLCS